MGETTILSKLDFEPILKPGQVARLEPTSSFGWYAMPRNQVPEPIVGITVNMASFSSQLAAFSTTGNQTPKEAEVSSLDMQTLNLGHFRLVALDDVLFQVKQPAATGKFNVKDGPVRFGIETQVYFEQGMWSMLPEIFVFGDNLTRPTINVVNTDPSRTTAYARFKAFGYRYPLQKLKEQSEPALTIRLENDR